MNFIKFIFITYFLLLSISVKAEINVSHAIAMHGEPKYNKDFISVEYVSNSQKFTLL